MSLPNRGACHISEQQMSLPLTDGGGTAGCLVQYPPMKLEPV